jgi:hypothetical protein
MFKQNLTLKHKHYEMLNLGTRTDVFLVTTQTIKQHNSYQKQIRKKR